MPHHSNLTYWGIVMNEQDTVVYSVYVGIDWADLKHDVCIQSKASDEREFAVISHRSEARSDCMRLLGCSLKQAIYICLLQT